MSLIWMTSYNAWTLAGSICNWHQASIYSSTTTVMKYNSTSDCRPVLMWLSSYKNILRYLTIADVGIWWVYFYTFYVTHLLYKQSHLDRETGRRREEGSRQIETGCPGGSDSECSHTQHCQGEVDSQRMWTQEQLGSQANEKKPVSTHWASVLKNPKLANLL